MPEHRIGKMLDEARKSSQIVKKAGQKAKEKAEIPAKREKTALVLSSHVKAKFAQTPRWW